MTDFLKQQLISELTSDVSEEITNFVEKIVASFPFEPMGVIFYGSNLRKKDFEGILDFYIITQNSSDYPGGSISKFFNKYFPPYVYYKEENISGKILRAKIACISYKQLLKKSFLESYDTTIWARFCQPTRLVWVRDPQSADKILDILRNSLITASSWAALLGPEKGTIDEFWHNLFAHTYYAELRVEKKGRSHHILQDNEERYSKILIEVWKLIGVRAPYAGGAFYPVLSKASRLKAQKRWRLISKLGKFFNICRLLKAAFTFKDGVKYIVWKIQRHTNHVIKLSNFEEKHPFLSFLTILWKLRVLKK